MRLRRDQLRMGFTIAFLTISALIMIYPLVWLFFASFKPNNEIFGSLQLLPKQFVWNSYTNGWKGSGQFTFGVFLLNTIKMVVPVVAFTVISSTIVAYGFARFQFALKNVFFAIMISTLMLPNAVIIIPRFILFKEFGWLNSYLPFTMPALFACYPFFIFMMVQFFRGLPRELDESATIDGCNSFGILTKILMPLCKPAIFSSAIFQFIWTWNDFFNSLIYINSVKKFTLALGLRMSLDVSSAAKWNEVMAMSMVAIIPCVIIFFFSQKYFVEGIATTGLKG